MYISTHVYSDVVIGRNDPISDDGQSHIPPIDDNPLLADLNMTSSCSPPGGRSLFE